MLGASLGLIYEGGRYGVERTVLGVVAGAIFIFVSQRLIDSHGALHLGSLEGADATKALLIVGIMTIHSFAEGVGVGVAFGVEEKLGILIGLAIAVHNIPEGLAISLVLVPRGTSPRTAAAWSIFSSLPQPLMAVPAFLFVEAFSEFLPVGSRICSRSDGLARCSGPSSRGTRDDQAERGRRCGGRIGDCDGSVHARPALARRFHRRSPRVP